MNQIVGVLLNRIMIWLTGPDLWERAQSWVALYENKDIPSSEKRERVLVMLEQELKTLGKELSASLINFAIEAALQYIRCKSK